MEKRSGGIVLSDLNARKNRPFCSVVAEAHRRLGGTRAGLLEIISKLSRPIPQQIHFMDDLQESFFQATLNFSGRQPVDLPKSESMYRGGWYWQGLENTCVSWSIVNGLKVVGMSIDPYCVLGVVCEARAWQGRGLSFNEAAGVIRRFNVPCWIEQSPSGQINNDYKLPDEWYWSVARTQPPSRARKFNDSQEALEVNGRLIKSCIDNRKPLLVLVEHPFWTRGSDDLIVMKHGICISGYKICSDGIMNVQVIDPYLGVLKTSLEHLSRSARPLETRCLQKTSRRAWWV